MQECPYCHQRPVSNWRKAIKGTGQLHTCESCGGVVIVSGLAMLPFLAWLLGSMVGLRVFGINHFSLLEFFLFFIPWSALYMTIHIRYVPLREWAAPAVVHKFSDSV